MGWRRFNTVAIFLLRLPRFVLLIFATSMTDAFKLRFFEKMAGLENLSAYAMDKLFGCVVEKRFLKGQNVLEQGKICRHIYFVESGFLRIFTIKAGNELNTDFVFENSFTSNLKSLRTGVASDHSIQAGESARIWLFDKDKLLSTYSETQELESFGRKIVEQLLIRQETHTQLFTLFNAKERYDYLITHQPEIIQRVSLSQICTYLGIARETLSRIRKQS